MGRWILGWVHTKGWDNEMLTAMGPPAPGQTLPRGVCAEGKVTQWGDAVFLSFPARSREIIFHAISHSIDSN